MHEAPDYSAMARYLSSIQERMTAIISLKVRALLGLCSEVQEKKSLFHSSNKAGATGMPE